MGYIFECVAFVDPLTWIKHNPLQNITLLTSIWFVLATAVWKFNWGMNPLRDTRWLPRIGIVDKVCNSTTFYYVTLVVAPHFEPITH